MNMDVLREFAEVARQQSFSKAAHGFYLSQPTLSKHIAALEAEVGSALILRTHGKVSLTPAGEVFLEGATRILGEFDATMSQMSLLNEKRSDKLVVALQTDIDAHLRIYSKSIQIARSLFEESRPGSVVAVKQQEDGYAERLAKGQWDACFVIDVHDARTGSAQAEPGLERAWICDLAPAILVREGHRLAGRTKVSWDDLEGEAYHDVRTDSVTNYLATIESFVKENKVACAFSGNTSVGMYEGGVFVFAHQLSPIVGLASVDLDEPNLVFGVHVGYPSSSVNPLLEDFVACARMAAKECGCAVRTCK